MADPIERRLEIVPSGSVQEGLERLQLGLLPDRVAMDGLAAALGVLPLPDKQRILLLNPDESPHTSEHIMVMDVPTLEETDLVVTLPRKNVFITDNLTYSLAMALMERRRSAQRARLTRFGAAIAGLGAAASGAGYVAHNKLQQAGWGLLAAGLSLIGWVNWRGAPIPPDTSEFDSPIRVVDNPR